jgi:hypothetical protein
LFLSEAASGLAYRLEAGAYYQREIVDIMPVLPYRTIILHFH